MKDYASRLARPATRLLFTVFPLALAGCHRGKSQDVEAKILFTQVPQPAPGDKNSLRQIGSGYIRFPARSLRFENRKREWNFALTFSDFLGVTHGLTP